MTCTRQCVQCPAGLGQLLVLVWQAQTLLEFRLSSADWTEPCHWLPWHRQDSTVTAQVLYTSNSNTKNCWSADVTARLLDAAVAGPKTAAVWFHTAAPSFHLPCCSTPGSKPSQPPPSPKKTHGGHHTTTTPARALLCCEGSHKAPSVQAGAAAAVVAMLQCCNRVPSCCCAQPQQGP